MKAQLRNLVILFSVLVLLSFGYGDQKEDKCPCKAESELTQRDLLCMNSASKIFSCLTDHDISKDQLYSYAFQIYTGEQTIINRYNKDELPLIVKNNLLKAKKFIIRGVRLKNEFGRPSDKYLRGKAVIKFRNYERDEL